MHQASRSTRAKTSSLLLDSNNNLREDSTNPSFSLEHKNTALFLKDGETTGSQIQRTSSEGVLARHLPVPRRPTTLLAWRHGISHSSGEMSFDEIVGPLTTCSFLLCSDLGSTAGLSICLSICPRSLLLMTFLGWTIVLRRAMHNSPSLLGLVLHLLKHSSQTHAHLFLSSIYIKCNTIECIKASSSPSV
jgi:hypothetical protein